MPRSSSVQSRFWIGPASHPPSARYQRSVQNSSPIWLAASRKKPWTGSLSVQASPSAESADARSSDCRPESQVRTAPAAPTPTASTAAAWACGPASISGKMPGAAFAAAAGSHAASAENAAALPAGVASASSLPRARGSHASSARASEPSARTMGRSDARTMGVSVRFWGQGASAPRGAGCAELTGRPPPGSPARHLQPPTRARNARGRPEPDPPSPAIPLPRCAPTRPRHPTSSAKHGTAAAPGSRPCETRMGAGAIGRAKRAGPSRRSSPPRPAWAPPIRKPGSPRAGWPTGTSAGRASCSLQWPGRGRLPSVGRPWRTSSTSGACPSRASTASTPPFPAGAGSRARRPGWSPRRMRSSASGAPKPVQNARRMPAPCSSIGSARTVAGTMGTPRCSAPASPPMPDPPAGRPWPCRPPPRWTAPSSASRGSSKNRAPSASRWPVWPPEPTTRLPDTYATVLAPRVTEQGVRGRVDLTALAVAALGAATGEAHPFA